jgi:hypothetical protein
MPRLLEGYTELVGSKMKKVNGFLEPNLEVLPKLGWLTPVFIAELRIDHPQVSGKSILVTRGQSMINSPHADKN